MNVNKININQSEQTYYIASQVYEVNAAKEDALQAIAENEQSAITNFNSQRVTPDMLSESTKQLIEASGGGTITNLADDEDITSVDDGTGSNVLKFADRTYNPDNFSGKGYKILRKNIIDGKNVLTQDMLNEENTIYEIKYDFDLNGETINIPNNCVLRFNGGILSNGVLKGNNTYIRADIIQIFQIDLILKGSWKIDRSYPEWFGAKGDGLTDDTETIQKLIDIRFPIYLIKRYAVTSLKVVNKPIVIYGISKENFGGVLVGIKSREAIIHFSGQSSNGSIIKNLSLTHAEGVTEAIGIYSEAVLVNPYHSAGLWFAIIDNVTISNFYIAIKLWAIDDETYDVANQYFCIYNLVTRYTTYCDIYIDGQLGQNTLESCYFENPNGEYVIYSKTYTTNFGGGTYFNANNCSFVGSVDKYLLKYTGTRTSYFLFTNCWFEGIKVPLISSDAIGNFIFSKCFFSSCLSTYLLGPMGSVNKIEFSKCIGVEAQYDMSCSSEYQSGMYFNIKNDGFPVIKDYYRIDTRIIASGEECNVFINSIKTIIHDAIGKGNYSNLVVNVTKHTAYQYTLSGIYYNEKFVGYVKAGQTVLLTKHQGRWFISSTTGPIKSISGTSEERTNVIDTTLISAGFQYFDTTLNKLVIWNGTNWVDVAGQTV